MTINGKDKKVPKEQQYVFHNHHPKIFDDDTMTLLFETKESRHHSQYRGQRTHINLFSGCLYCKDCGLKLTAINRPNRGKYYVCGTYNKKGKQFCRYAHLVTEESLMDALVKYLILCRDSLADIIQNFDLAKLKVDTYTPTDNRQRLESELEKAKDELKLLISQKIKEITANPSMNEIINETYASLQAEKMERITAIEKTLQSLTKEPHVPSNTIKPSLQTVLDILNEVLEKKVLSRKEMGYPMHKKKFVTYMKYLFDLGLVEKTGIYHDPYKIAATRQQLRDVENMFIMIGQSRRPGFPPPD